MRAFYWKAYEDNLTGQSAMVAYNLLLSILPLALLSLFIAGQIVESNALEQSVIRDLRKIFPGAAEQTVANALTLPAMPLMKEAINAVKPSPGMPEE